MNRNQSYKRKLKAGPRLMTVADKDRRYEDDCGWKGLEV